MPTTEESVEKLDADLEDPEENDETAPSSQDDDDDHAEREDEVPLLKYARTGGSLPRLPKRVGGSPFHPLSSACTCSKLGRVILPPELVTPEAASAEPKAPHTNKNADLWRKPHIVMACGFQSGQVHFVDAQSGLSIIPPEQLRVKEGNHADPIVDVSLDASGTFLAAINTTGVCAIWEVKYTSGKSKGAASSTPPPPDPPPTDNPFASFLSTLANQAVPSNTTADPSTNNPTVLKTLSVQVFRITYPASFGSPTILCLDPSYKRRREKAVMVGFADGRLMLTKRGILFQRRNDAVIYQGSRGTGGIEAIEWRGALVAWADASGIKLFDVESMTRIAHVDRPTGARPALYPTISSLKPIMCFETSDNLLVAWGDCVMTMKIKETISGKPMLDNPTVGMTGLPADAPTPTDAVATVVKRRTVECSMAWELDCIACGVVPLDADNLVILGLVPNMDEGGNAPREAGVGGNDLEVQVISRAEGAIVYADALPVIRLPSHFYAAANGVMQESGGAYRLLSSFAIPRMDDTVEAEEEGILAADQDFDFNIFAAAAQTVFEDSHFKWNIKSVAFEKDDAAELTEENQENEPSEATEEIKGTMTHAEEDDAKSVDSDDYEFILRPTSSDRQPTAVETTSPPPFMVVVASADIIGVRIKDIDDAISHSLATQKIGLALLRGLRHKRQLRKHELNDLVDEYLRAVLRISRDDSNGEQKPLSIRRLKLAVAATPTLLGGNVPMWERWIDEFRRIPGALFVLRDFIPVRDPLLPTHVYDNVLRTMLKETEEMLSGESKDGELSADASNRATRRFLGTITAWGPTQGLRDKIKFHQYFNEQQSKLGGERKENKYIEESKDALTRRLTQSAAGYLQLGSSTVSPRPELKDTMLLDSPPDSPSDSLFDVDDMVKEVSSRVTVFGRGVRSVDKLSNGRVAMETLAELHMMVGRHEEALQVFMALGCLYPTKDISELENEAVNSVNHWDNWVEGRSKSSSTNPYGFVLSMIEYHLLHQCLLDMDFLPPTDGLSTPLISLIRLVGLESVGDFLVEHCVPPPAEVHFVPGSIESRSSVDNPDSKEEDGKEILPLNLVAEQLLSNQKLCHWYLHLIFMRRPEMYVTFPTTAVPPRSVTELHRTHLDLYIDFANDKDSAKSLVGTDSYNVVQKTTPLLCFLKAALPLGGIRPMEVRRLLEAQREDSSDQFPHSFAIELAYVIEYYGKDSEEDALTILDLYLKGAKSVMLATSYSLRNAKHTVLLWNTLIQYCLEGSSANLPSHTGQDTKDNGTLFGSLLESAAVCGADLALLVTRIPQGMKIEGLRPRLVAAVGDYRLKLKMHEASSDICNREKVNLLRELNHRSRRGMRYVPDAEMEKEGVAQKTRGVVVNTSVSSVSVHGKNTSERPSHYRRAMTLPMR
jgi:vacuolar protein sorting-associated protein 41